MTEPMNRPSGFLPGLTPKEALVADLTETALDEDLDHSEAKAKRIIEGKEEGVGPWMVAWSAREVLPIINRLRQAEARFTHDCGASIIKHGLANGFGTAWREAAERFLKDHEDCHGPRRFSP